MGLKLATSDFRLLLRWWLGLHLTDEPVATCHLCGGFVDPFGDHYLCCPRGGFYNRHQTVVAHLSHVAKAAGLRVSFEEIVPEGIRPADMLISSWPTTGTSLAIDVSVVHPLGLSHLPHLIARSDAYLEQAERVKENAYTIPCGNVGWQFAPVPLGYKSLARSRAVEAPISCRRRC